MIKMINYMFWVEQVGVDPPPPPPPPPKGERPKCYSRLDMNLDNVSSRKCWKGVWRPAVKTRKSVAHKRKENHDLIN